MDDAMVEQVDAGWSVREFRGLELGDARLNKRLLTVAEAFGAQPQAPINQASSDWQATKAAYALFANPKVTPTELLVPHQDRTLERIEAYERVLLVQDTTFLNYTHHPATQGLGPIGGSQRGLVMHSTLAFTPEGLPLGLLTQQIWARAEPDPQASKKKQAQRPLTEKESRKWLDALEAALPLIPSEIHAVTIADREADIFDFLTTADELSAPYLIRAAQDRKVAGELGRLWAHLANEAVAGEVRVRVGARGGKPERIATLSVRSGQVTLQPPQRPWQDPGVWFEPLQVWALSLHEETPPPEVTPLDWLLLTNVRVTSWQDVLERIAWYCVRPGIESFHKILKSGCTVKEMANQVSRRPGAVGLV
jgi:hypothetical protein